MSGSSNDSSPAFLSCSLIICVNIDLVRKFFETLFEIPHGQTKETPCRYVALQLSSQATVVLVESASLDEEMKAAFASASVRQLFLHDRGIKIVQARALQMGALITQSADGHGESVVEGPEGILIHVIGPGMPGKPASDTIIKSILDRLEERSAGSLPSAVKAPTARPRLRTVDVCVQSDYHPLGITPCPANNILPTPFETELFKGTAMMMVRTDPLDDNFRKFFDNGKKRTFEVQVQGKFKRMPVGEIYVGADVTNKMELGIITRSFSKAILKFVRTMVNDLHYSFGDSPGAVGFEKPHIVAPLFSTMDKIVETAAGGEPPPMGLPFPEDPEYRRIRMSNRKTNDMINLSSTYSFSVNTSNMDLITWSLVGIPMLNPIDMRTFVGESPVRLVGYELPAEEAAKHPEKHPAAAMNYVFNMRLTRLDGPGREYESNSDVESGAEEELIGEVPNPAMLLDAIEEDQDERQDSKSTDDEKNDDDSVTDANGKKTKMKVRRLFGRGGNTEPPETKGRRSKKLGQWLGSKKREVGEFFHRDRELHNTVDGSTVAADDAEHAAEDASMEADDDLRFCPACIDALDPRKDGKRRTLFAFPWVPALHDWSDGPSGSQVSPGPKLGSQLLHAAYASSMSVLATGVSEVTPPFIIKLRSHSDFVRTFPVVKVSKLSNQKAKRLSTVERERRQLAEIYATMLAKGASYNSVMDAFFGAPSDTDRLFLGVSLSKGGGGSNTTPKKTEDELWEGSVAFATDKRHWVEGIAFMSRNEIIFCKSADSKKPVFSIRIKSIISVRAMLPEEVPMDMFGFFQIETFSRVLYFMVRNDLQLDAWLSAFSAVGVTSMPNYSEMSLSKLVEDLYFGESTAWRLEKKRLFNYRNIIFRRTGISAEFSDVSVTQLAEGLILQHIFCW